MSCRPLFAAGEQEVCEVLLEGRMQVQLGLLEEEQIAGLG